MHFTPTVIGEIVLPYLSKYPYSSSKFLAELITEEHPELFVNSEQARRMVRYYRGATGVDNRRTMNLENYHPKINMEETLGKPYLPYEITDAGFPVLVGADAHVPFHNQDAVEIFFEYGLKMKPIPKTILLLGDWLDMFLMSDFTKDPTMMEPQDEIDMLKRLLDQVKAAYPKGTKIIYKFGNHEERFDNYIMKHAPRLYKTAKCHLDEVLGLDDSVDIVQDKRVVKIGKLYGIHGHEYKMSIQNPVNPARGLFLRTKKSSICAHFHQTSEHTEPSISGNVITDWSLGCLCSLSPEYMPLNRWNLGFATIQKDDGLFMVDNKRIVNNRVL